MSDYHSLDKRVHSLEEWREHMRTIDLPSILETIETEIPAHYTKRITESEANTMLRIKDLIDDRLKARFGWISSIATGIVQAVLIVLAIKVLGL
jgi:hypothetical protein